MDNDYIWDLYQKLFRTEEVITVRPSDYAETKSPKPLLAKKEKGLVAHATVFPANGVRCSLVAH